MKSLNIRSREQTLHAFQYSFYSTMIRRIFLSIFLFILACSTQADRIVMKDGRVIEGVIYHDPNRVGEHQVVLKMGDGRVMLDRREIETIVEATPGENALLMARDALQIERPGEAALAIARTIELGGSLDGLAMLLVKHGRILFEQFDQLDTKARAALRSALPHLQRAKLPQQDDLHWILAALYFKLGDRDSARHLLGFVDSNPSPQASETQGLLLQWLNGEIERVMAKKEYLEGLALLKDMESVDLQAAQARRIQFFLEWARHHRQANEYEQALGIYRDYVASNYPQITEELVLRTLEEAENHLRLQDQLPRAAKLYEQFGLPLAPDHARRQLAELWRDQAWRLVRADALDEADYAFKQAEQYVEGSTTLDRQRMEYRRKLAQIEPGDLIGRYEIGVWALEQGLHKEALNEFRIAERSDIVGRNARAYIGKLQNILAEQELEEIMNLYEGGEFVRALNEIHQFHQAGYLPGYIAQARQIEELIREAMRLRAAERPQQAEALYQQAERAFYQDDYRQAQEKLETLLEHYPDSIVYPRARNLYQVVREKVLLQDLEKGRQTAQADAPTTHTQAPVGVEGSQQTEPRMTRKEIDKLYEELERIVQ